MKILVAGALLCALCAPVVAQNGAAPAAKQAAPSVGAGELRLDGKIKGMLNVGEWQMEAISWTSPRDVTTTFADPKSKTVRVNADAFIHPVGETDKIALKDVKLGDRIAVIGKNAADGSLQVREVILLEGYGARKSIGTLSSNSLTSRLVDQSRKARDQGNLPQALKLANDAINAAQGAGDLSGEGLATQDKTMLLLDMDEIEAAGQSAARVESLGRSLSNPLLIVMGMNTRGRVLAETGQLDKAIEVFEAADPISAGSEPQLQLSTLSGLVQVYGQAERTPDVIATLQRIFPIEESLRERDDATATLLSLARALAPTNAAKAREYLTQAAPRIDEATDEKMRAGLLVMAGDAKYRLADKTGAQADFEAAAKLYEGAGEAARAQTTRAIFAKMEARKPGTPAPVANEADDETE